MQFNVRNHCRIASFNLSFGVSFTRPLFCTTTSFSPSCLVSPPFSSSPCRATSPKTNYGRAVSSARRFYCYFCRSFGHHPQFFHSTVLNPEILKWTVSSPPSLLVYLTRLASRHIRSRITVVCAEVCGYGFVGLRFLANMKLVQAPQTTVRQAKPLRLLRKAGYCATLPIHCCCCGEDVRPSVSPCSLGLTAYPQRRAIPAQPASNSRVSDRPDICWWISRPNRPRECLLRHFPFPS